MTDIESIKIVVMGIGGVGKSALTVSYAQDIFVERYDPTIEDVYRKVFTLEGEKVELEILDTADSCSFTAMRDLYIKQGEGFVLCYSIVSASSFNDLNSHIDSIVRVRNLTELAQVPIVLVGTKVDLDYQRTVSTEQGQDLAFRLGCEFIECSAKARVNVETPFLKMASRILDLRKVNGYSNQPKKKNRGNNCNLL